MNSKQPREFVTEIQRSGNCERFRAGAEDYSIFSRGLFYI